MIYVYNTHIEDHSSEKNNFPIYRGTPLGNPFTHNGVKSNIAKLSFKTREEAIEAYKVYFKKSYGVDEELTRTFDNIYEHYRNGEDIYLQCFCTPLPCHGNFLANELQRKLILEKRKEKAAKLQ